MDKGADKRMRRALEFGLALLALLVTYLLLALGMSFWLLIPLIFFIALVFITFYRAIKSASSWHQRG